jgi:hypothetical protein
MILMVVMTIDLIHNVCSYLRVPVGEGEAIQRNDGGGDQGGSGDGDVRWRHVVSAYGLNDRGDYEVIVPTHLLMIIPAWCREPFGPAYQS